MPIRPKDIINIERFINRHQMELDATGTFSNILVSIALAGKYISRDVNRAGLLNILGAAGKTNIQGESVQKLDLIANQILIDLLSENPHVAIMGSEEMADPIECKNSTRESDYVISFDPLDGSSNIDANASIGTIFSIQRRITKGDHGTEEDLLQEGRKQIAAGYIIYGSSTMMVYTTGKGVHGFTFDPTVGEFLLSHENITTPEHGKIYSANEGNVHNWEEGFGRYLNYVKVADAENNRPYSGRYIGSLVADFHRNLLYGGIFLYPANKKTKKGKLRLLYEANPLAMICEQAGGLASNGDKPILDIKPTELHERTPLIIGSKHNVTEALDFLHGRRK